MNAKLAKKYQNEKILNTYLYILWIKIVNFVSEIIKTT